jgi:hypothetical protein
MLLNIGYVSTFFLLPVWLFSNFYDNPLNILMNVLTNQYIILFAFNAIREGAIIAVRAPFIQ